jgi:hypothetical protein
MDGRRDEFPGVDYPPTADELLKRDREPDSPDGADRLRAAGWEQERMTGGWRHRAKAPAGALTLAEALAADRAPSIRPVEN